jgi:protoporphyrinogen oxidase
VVIIGAGPAGLTAAYELIKHGRRALVVEQDPHYVGGLARTIQFKTFRFDIGGHRFFSKSPEIEQLWEEICGEDFLRRPRLSRILYRGKFFDYPLKAANALRGLGIPESAACVLSYLRSAAFPRRPEVSFEDWVVNRFGRRLFEIFFRTYTEKVWGMPCAEISADWASQRIKGLSLPTAIINALLPRRHRADGRTIKSLIDSFRYPRLGPGMMWELARDRVVTAGGSVEMGKRVTAIRHDGRRVLEIEAECVDGRTERIAGSHFISSMPLRDVMQRWEPAPPPDVLAAARALTYRDLVLVALVVRRANLFPDNWIYIHDPGVKVGRIQNFRAWSPDMVPDPELSCLGLEYFCSEGDGVWTMSDPDLVATAGRELAHLGLVGPAELEDGTVVRATKAYPVYDPHYEARVRVIRQYLEHGFSNFQVVGRNGMHKYNNQDHSMMTALLAARNILGGRFDVWRVNADAEYHEEDAVVSEAPSRSRLSIDAVAKRSPQAGRSSP